MAEIAETPSGALPQQKGALAQMGELQIDKSLPSGAYTREKSSYQERVAAALQRALRLPEVGDTRVTLTLSSQGHLIRCVIEQSESAENKLYIEDEIMGISFPPFGKELAANSELSFTMTLTNRR